MPAPDVATEKNIAMDLVAALEDMSDDHRTRFGSDETTIETVAYLENDQVQLVLDNGQAFTLRVRESMP